MGARKENLSNIGYIVQNGSSDGDNTFSLKN